MIAMLTARGNLPYRLSFLLGLWMLKLTASVEVDPTKIPLNYKVVCQGQRLVIRCHNSSYGLDIQGATYGRTLSGSIVCSYQGHESDFYYNCGENDVQSKLTDLCHNKKKCSFVVGTGLFGDPCKGRAYLNLVYRCIPKQKKKNRNETPRSTAITTTYTKSTGNDTLATAINITKVYYNHNGSMASNTTGSPKTNTTENATELENILQVSKISHENPGIMISMVMWIVYVKERWSSFKIVFFVSVGVSLFLLIVAFIIYLIMRRKSQRKRKRHHSNNREIHNLKLVPKSTINGDIKIPSDVDTLSNSFPAPISALPPPPDDMMYPSPSPDMVNPTRPPPPPAPRGSSMDDISKIGKDRNSKNVELTRSLSMRTRPPDYYSKDVNYEKFSPNFHTLQCCPEINSVLPNKESTMYMNPMYENRHIKEVTC